MGNEVERWWKQSIEDLETAKFNFKGERYEAAAFFAQQAAEKALKALYIRKFKKLKKTHDLFLLANELKLPEGLINLCKEVGPAYVYTRYPDVTKIKDISTVSENLIEYSSKILKWIKEKI